jgi:hypothetical protein
MSKNITQFKKSIVIFTPARDKALPAEDIAFSGI